MSPGLTEKERRRFCWKCRRRSRRTNAKSVGARIRCLRKREREREIEREIYRERERERESHVSGA